MHVLPHVFVIVAVLHRSIDRDGCGGLHGLIVGQVVERILVIAELVYQPRHVRPCTRARSCKQIAPHTPHPLRTTHLCIDICCRALTYPFRHRQQHQLSPAGLSNEQRADDIEQNGQLAVVC